MIAVIIGGAVLALLTRRDGVHLVVAVVLLGAICAVLGSCATYVASQMPQCETHCNFTAGGRQVVGRPTEEKGTR